MFLRRNVFSIVFTSKTMYKCDELSRSVFLNVRLGNSMPFESHILDLLKIKTWFMWFSELRWLLVNDYFIWVRAKIWWVMTGSPNPIFSPKLIRFRLNILMNRSRSKITHITNCKMPRTRRHLCDIQTHKLGKAQQNIQFNQSNRFHSTRNRNKITFELSLIFWPFIAGAMCFSCYIKQRT